MPETITLTKALVELKLLSKRIDTLVNNFEPVAVRKGKGENGTFEASIKSQPDFEKKAKATWQSINDLISRRRKIKTVLVLANASTPVEIAGEKMTIAEAIERKNLIEIEKELVYKMRKHLAEKHDRVDMLNRDMERRLQRLLESTYGNKDVQLSKVDHERIAKPYKESNEAVVVDPLNCEKIIHNLEERYDAFLADVDVALSIANARTEITI